VRSMFPKGKLVGPVANRAVERSLEHRRAAFQDEFECLVKASFRVIRKTGKMEPRVNDVIAEAGLSNQAFYKHFRSKDELLLAMLDAGSSRLRSYIEHRMQAVNTPEQKIREWICGMLEQALNEDAAHLIRPFALSRARLSDLFPNEVMDAEMQVTNLVRDAIQEAVATGAMPAADPERDSEVIYNMVFGWLERRLVNPEQLEKTDTVHPTEFIIHGLLRGVRPRLND
jgi:AcrR family transcriptional regulator